MKIPSISWTRCFKSFVNSCLLRLFRDMIRWYYLHAVATLPMLRSYVGMTSLKFRSRLDLNKTETATNNSFNEN